MGVTAINGRDITASLATNATNAVSASTQLVTANATYYLVFVDANNLTSTPEVLGTVGDLNFNPNTGIFQARTITASAGFTSSAGFFGTSSWSRNSVTSSRAQQLETITNATNATFYPLFVDSANGTTAPELVYSNGTFTFNPSTQEFRAGAMNQGTLSNFTNTADANLQFNAAITQSMYWVASFTATRSLIVDNITQGRMVRVYIRNTNATQRQISFSGSTTATGHAAINMAISAGGASATTQNIGGSNGTMYVTMENIGGFIVGGIM